MLWAFVLIAALGAAQGPYGNVWRETWANLDDWVIDVQEGMDTGNHEWEYYTNSTENVNILTDETGANYLLLQAKYESPEYQGYNYTSGKIHSKQMLGPYGFFNVRATVPKGVGLWPAIWMFPIDGSPYGAWSAGGEIDLMETICPSPPGYATLHFGGQQPNNTQWPWPPNNEYPFVVDWSMPHNFGVEWTPSYFRFWFDAEVVEDGSIQGTGYGYIPSSQWWSQNASGQHYPLNAPFDAPENMILNLAIGGDWTCATPGCCNQTAVQASMPVNMTVNFVEWWQMIYRETPVVS